MIGTSNRLNIIVGITGFLGVALGAFGAHALKSTLESTGFLTTWNTAVLYHLVHVLLMYQLVITGRTRAFWVTFVGIVLFSGSLYVMSVSGVRGLGAVTPVGGICFLVGWLLLIVPGKDR